MTSSPDPVNDQAVMAELLEAVHQANGIDLGNYAKPSLRRRIQRFTEMRKIRGMEELVQLVRKNNDGFVDLFIDEITVGVTEMFRNPGFWVALKEKVIPVLREKALIHIWHAGCSMGEEVYSMAILLREAGLLEKSRIVATDINHRALETALSGIYPLKNQENNSINYAAAGGSRMLSDYYRVNGSAVQYDESLRQRVEFRRHDLSAEGPFAVCDLLICRNVFIYFNLDLQERVLDLFIQSLDKGSFLGIGSKESIRWCKGANYFNITDLEENIFQKRY